VRIYTSPTTDSNGPVRVGSTSVFPVTTVRDLGVYLDADVSMAVHVTATVKACFAAPRQIRSVRHSLSREALLTLIRALIVSKLDYCCSVLAGVLEHCNVGCNQYSMLLLDWCSQQGSQDM